MRSCTGSFVTVSGLPWLCLLRLAPIPWAERTWALPCLPVLAPSARHDRDRGRRHKTLTDWARQRRRQVRRGCPGRALVVVADSGDAASALLACCAQLARPVTLVTRLRLDAARDAPAPARQLGQRGRPRAKGRRLPTRAARRADPATVWPPIVVAHCYGAGPRTVAGASATALWDHRGLPPVSRRRGTACGALVRDPAGHGAPHARRCTALPGAPAQVLARFGLRRRRAVTVEEPRRHRGVETRHHWSGLALLRTTPALLARFSVVTRYAPPQTEPTTATVRQAAW